MEYSNIPTNRNERTELGLKKIYASQELIDTLASYEYCKEVESKHGIIEEPEYYWFDNKAWDKNEPLGLISASDAIEEDKPGCAFIYFDSTVPAFTKSAVSKLLNQ